MYINIMKWSINRGPKYNSDGGFVKFILTKTLNAGVGTILIKILF